MFKFAKTILNFMKERQHFFMILTIIFMLSACKKDKKEDVIDAPYVFKENLSEYKFFNGEIKNLNPANGVFKYDLATTLFTDYTIKDRFIKLPEGKSILYKREGILEFPAGTVIIKNFSHPRKSGGIDRIETRLLVLDPYNNEWNLMTYIWNDAQTDAVKNLTGKDDTIDVLDDTGEWITTVYRIPSTTIDCKKCHSLNSKITPIGPKANNLNFIPEFSTENQLKSWSKDVIIKDLPSSGVPILPVWEDSINFDLNQRARAYLEVNCAHCHNEDGFASKTGLYLTYDQMNTSKLGYFKVPLDSGAGSGFDGLIYDIVPGNADSSVVIYRMNSNIKGVRMPGLGRSIVHKEGVELIRNWINSL
jgi:uncharacterized repeat protein (TIGR03806 family)